MNTCSLELRPLCGLAGANVNDVPLAGQKAVLEWFTIANRQGMW
ncbi:MAG: hypothetical protein VB858_20605 [Planctomycetaceae bacterium]